MDSIVGQLPPRSLKSNPSQSSERKDMFALIGAIFVGLIVGLLARALKPGDDKLGWIMTIVLGIAGSMLARYVGVAMGWYLPGAPAGWIASIVGAMVLLVVYGLIRKR